MEVGQAVRSEAWPHRNGQKLPIERIGVGTLTVLDRSTNDLT